MTPLPKHLRHLVEAFLEYQDVKVKAASSDDGRWDWTKALLKQRLVAELRRHKAADINQMLEYAAALCEARCEARTQSGGRCRHQRRPGHQHCKAHFTDQDRRALPDPEATILAVPRPSLPIVECEDLPDAAVHLMEPAMEQRTQALLSWNYATIGRRPSRRYEGYGLQERQRR